MKVIFLDIDGALNTTSHRHSLYQDHLDADKTAIKVSVYKDQYGVMFDPICEYLLRVIVEATDAKIVLSSTWKYSGLRVMQDMWECRSLAGEVIDVTTDSYTLGLTAHLTRGDEIGAWIDEHEDEIESYVIIDDVENTFTSDQMKRAIITDHDVGLTFLHAHRAIRLLNNIN